MATHSSILAWEIPWALALKAPLSVGFSTQEYWSGLPRPPPGDLPNPGIEPGSPVLQADSLPSEPPGKPLGVDTIQFIAVTYLWVLSIVTGTFSERVNSGPLWFELCFPKKIC